MSETNSTELAVMQQPLNALVVFGPGGVDDILAKLEAEVKGIPLDISTVAGRKQVASVAYKIARSKTALDDMGKELVADWKAKAGKVDEDRRKIRERLDALKDEIRKPLTEWEEAEKARVAGHEQALAAIRQLAAFDTAEPALELIASRTLQLNEISRRDWQEFSARAAGIIKIVAHSLVNLSERRQRQETERAELARLRAEDEARRQRERDELIAIEAAAAARKAAEEAAAKAAKEAAEKAAAELAAANAERERVEREKREAEERAAKAEADRIAAEQKAEQDRIEAERLAEQRAKEAAEQAERDRQKAIEDERARVAAEQQKLADEAAARERDKKHKAKINNEAVAGLVQFGTITEEDARLVIIAIARGQIPHVTISY